MGSSLRAVALKLASANQQLLGERVWPRPVWGSPKIASPLLAAQARILPPFSKFPKGLRGRWGLIRQSWPGLSIPGTFLPFLPSHRPSASPSAAPQTDQQLRETRSQSVAPGCWRQNWVVPGEAGCPPGCRALALALAVARSRAERSGQSYFQEEPGCLRKNVLLHCPCLSPAPPSPPKFWDSWTHHRPPPCLPQLPPILGSHTLTLLQLKLRARGGNRT